MLVEKNNIFYQDHVGGETKRITKDGVPDIVFNGVSDWMYGGEIIIYVILTCCYASSVNEDTSHAF